jgi:hypothetical protein
MKFLALRFVSSLIIIVGWITTLAGTLMLLTLGSAISSAPRDVAGLVSVTFIVPVVLIISGLTQVAFGECFKVVLAIETNTRPAVPREEIEADASHRAVEMGSLRNVLLVLGLVTAVGLVVALLVH